MEQGDNPVPQSPQPTAVRQTLDQHGQPRDADEQTPQPPTPGSMQQRGATEHETVPIKTVMQDPANPAKDKRDAKEDDMDPRDELTPG
jgi:hypothetical protein